jgi:hypothetical protein
MMVGALLAAAPSTPPVDRHIPHVVLMRAHAKVRGVAARRVVARMEDVGSWRQRPVGVNPRQAVRPLIRPVDSLRPVSVLVRSCRPDPAFIGFAFGHLRPVNLPERGRRVKATSKQIRVDSTASYHDLSIAQGIC